MPVSCGGRRHQSAGFAPSGSIAIANCIRAAADAPGWTHFNLPERYPARPFSVASKSLGVTASDSRPARMSLLVRYILGIRSSLGGENAGDLDALAGHEAEPKTHRDRDAREGSRCCRPAPYRAQTSLFALNARAKAFIAASFRCPRLWIDSRRNPKRSVKVCSPLIPNVNRYRRWLWYGEERLYQSTDRPLLCQPYRRRERSPFPVRADRRTISRWKPTQPARAQQ